MRLLLADLDASPAVRPGADLDDDTLADLYAWQPRPGTWVRCNFAASLDGSITGPDGRSASVSSAADHVVFELLRALSDVVVVGAGTLRSEGYSSLSVDVRWQARRSALGLTAELPLVAVTRTGAVPPRLVGAPPGAVLIATHAHCPLLSEAREMLGADNVVVCGVEEVDEELLLGALADRGWSRILTEGGPHLLSSMVGAGVLDEVCLSVTPGLVGGDGPRMTTTAATPTGYLPRVLVEQDGTVMGRWLRMTG